MTDHVSVRSISALLLLNVSLLGLPGARTRAIRRRATEDRSHGCGAARPPGGGVRSQSHRFARAGRGARDRARRGSDFARGFGVADIERKTPVTPDTPFFIGSSTKAFTATLVGMLVDEGGMQWDEPAPPNRPSSKLRVQSKDPNDSRHASRRPEPPHRLHPHGVSRNQERTVVGRDSAPGIVRRSPCTVPAAIPLQQRALPRGRIGRGRRGRHVLARAHEGSDSREAHHCDADTVGGLAEAAASVERRAWSLTDGLRRWRTSPWTTPRSNPTRITTVGSDARPNSVCGQDRSGSRVDDQSNALPSEGERLRSGGRRAWPGDGCRVLRRARRPIHPQAQAQGLSNVNRYPWLGRAHRARAAQLKGAACKIAHERPSPVARCEGSSRLGEHRAGT